MTFRDRLVATLRAATPVLDEPGVMVIGSEVPNLLEPNAASTLVVSQDLDIGIPIAAHARVKKRLADLEGLTPDPEEPSVWVPESDELLEVNFVGIDPEGEPGDAHVLEDDEFPLMVFGALSLLREGEPAIVEGVRVPLPRIAGLLLEKLLTERVGDKGERDLLVALGLLLVSSEADLVEMEAGFCALPPDLRHAMRSNLTVLSLMDARHAMPDPRPQRERVSCLLQRLEGSDA